MDEQKVPVLTLDGNANAKVALEQAVAQLEAPSAPEADHVVEATLDAVSYTHLRAHET